MKTILDTRDFNYIPEYSTYNRCYYKSTTTGRILYEESDDDHGHSYWWTTEEDMKNHCHTNDEKIGECWMEDFDIPTPAARKLGVAKECVFEFDNEWL